LTPRTEIAPRVRSERLSNGVRVLLLENHANTTLEIVGLLEGGLLREPASRAGVAGLTFDMLDRGTRQRDEQAIAEALESNGASLRYEIGRETMMMRAHSLSEDEELLITLLGETLSAPSFPDDALDRAREEVLIDLREAAFDTFERAYRRAATLLLGEGHVYARDPDGEEAVVESLGREELIAHHQDAVAAERLTIAVAGDFEPARTLALLERHLAALPPEAPPGARDATGVGESLDAGTSARAGNGTHAGRGVREERIFIADKTQVDAVLMRRGIARTDPKFEAAAMANFLLGGSFVSRLNQRLRDREGLTYGADCAIVSGGHSGCWFASLSVDGGDLERAIALVREELRAFVEEGPGEEELARAQAHLTGSFPIRLETNQAVAAALLDSLRHGWGLDYVDRYADRVRALTRTQVAAAARCLIDPDDLVTVAAGAVSG
jgi:zinc protease